MAEAPSRLALDDCREALRQVAKTYRVFLERGDFSFGLYVPQPPDTQTPHAQDELYIVTSGSGSFWRDGEEIGFAAGDALFVPGLMPHRFESFSPDFSCWVVFFGPKAATA
jgi:mannose-6-phosphate isomerase-like protein (cupin superfamily)